MTALERIYRNINNGEVYGEELTNVRFPCFWYTLAADKNTIYWRSYGSSANKNTIRDLKWIITVIFRMTPEEFETTYVLKSNSYFA